MKINYLKGLVIGIAAITGLGPASGFAETYRVGMECTYSPFNYRDTEGNLVGYDVDVAEGIAELINADFEYVCQEWSGIIAGLLANKYDLIIASLSITEQRMEKIDYSIPYRVSIGRLVAPVNIGWELFDAEANAIPENFEGLRIGVERASNYADWFEARLPDVELVYYDGSEPLYLDLKNGRVDAIMTNPMKAYLVLLSGESEGQFEFVSPAIDELEFFGPGVGVGLRKGNDELRERINVALRQLIVDGKLEEYARKIFPFAIHNEAWADAE